MKKSDLRSGMMVENREGTKYVLIEVLGELIIAGKDVWNELDNFNDDLTNKSYPELDFMKVFYGKQGSIDTMFNTVNKRIVWEREEVKEVTMKEVCDKFGYQVKIVEG